MEDLLKACIQQRNEKLLVCRRNKIDRDANSVNRTAVSEAAYRQAVQQLEGCLEDEGSCIQDSSSIFLLLLQEDVPCIRSAPLIPILLDHPIHPPLGQAVANPFVVFLRDIKYTGWVFYDRRRREIEVLRNRDWSRINSILYYECAPDEEVIWRMSLNQLENNPACVGELCLRTS